MRYPPDYRLTRGWPLGESLKKADPTGALCDVETLQLLRIGAESGSLPEMLNKRADICLLYTSPSPRD